MKEIESFSLTHAPCLPFSWKKEYVNRHKFDPDMQARNSKRAYSLWEQETAPDTLIYIYPWHVRWSLFTLSARINLLSLCRLQRNCLFLNQKKKKNPPKSTNQPQTQNKHQKTQNKTKPKNPYSLTTFSSYVCVVFWFFFFVLFWICTATSWEIDCIIFSG